MESASAFGLRLCPPAFIPIARGGGAAEGPLGAWKQVRANPGNRLIPREQGRDRELYGRWPNHLDHAWSRHAEPDAGSLYTHV